MEMEKVMKKINKKSKSSKTKKFGCGSEGVFSHNNNAKIKLTVATAARLFQELTPKMSASSCMY